MYLNNIRKTCYNPREIASLVYVGREVYQFSNISKGKKLVQTEYKIKSDRVGNLLPGGCARDWK